MDEVIRASELSYSYPDSSEGIKMIDFDIAEGETVLLTGNSGSGKSTLLKCLNGLAPTITEGELKGILRVYGDDYSKLKMHELNKKIGSVFQNPRSQFFTDNTTAELVFPMENYGFPKEKMERRLKELTSTFGIEDLMNRDIYSLSSGERQMLALASSLTMHQKVLLFDEPSANLDYGNAMKLGRIIGDLKKKGYTIIVADHRFYYLKGILDKVLFMDNGNLVVYRSEEEFISSSYNTRSFDLFSIDIPCKPHVEEHKTVVSVNNVSYKDILKDISLDIKLNEVTALVGSNGVGKTTLAKLLCKSIKPDKGKIKTQCLPFFVMQDPDYQLFGTSVENELMLVKNDPEAIDRCIDYLGLLPYKYAHPFDLSGGQKQRLQIAMAMLCGKEVIIFDEPTSGLDVESMHKVADEIIKLKDNAAVIVISHDYEFLRYVADRIVYIADSTIKNDFYLDDDSLSGLNNIFIKMQEDILNE
jgi:energy-coupling factor transport system ATP-binding protein